MLRKASSQLPNPDQVRNDHPDRKDGIMEMSSDRALQCARGRILFPSGVVAASPFCHSKEAKWDIATL